MKQDNVGAPFERFGIDVSGLFLQSKIDNHYILVVTNTSASCQKHSPCQIRQQPTTVDVGIMLCRFNALSELHLVQMISFDHHTKKGVACYEYTKLEELHYMHSQIVRH